MSNFLNLIKLSFLAMLFLLGALVFTSALFPDSEIQVTDGFSESPMTLSESITWASITLDGSHAYNHAEYEMVRACTPQWELRIRASKHVDVCDMGDGKFGFRVWQHSGGNVSNGTASWREITAYIKENIHSYDDLVRFAESRGWSVWSK